MQLRLRCFPGVAVAFPWVCAKRISVKTRESKTNVCAPQPGFVEYPGSNTLCQIREKKTTHIILIVAQLPRTMAVVIETTAGDLTVDLFLDERPRACQNFLKLCRLKYYNYNLFHTIQQGFIAQTGDPSGVGDGGSSVWGVLEGTPSKRYFRAEHQPRIRHSEPGLLSMVSVGDGLIGAQFFLTLGADLTSLDAGTHCVIGQVTEGAEVLRTLNDTICDGAHRPYQDVRITHTVVLSDPFDDPRGFRAPSRSPSPSAERLAGGRIGADEDVDDTDGKSEQEVAEMRQEREARARATILEIVGDLPDADMAPPENVLFVCKLNPVTSDDDLEIIFSRFGRVVGCEVIRDRVSGDSLQYAFVEFEDAKMCESAYFKMDNVLIDDRRIHVDFSQSVAKVQWRGKGRGLIYRDGQKGDRLNFGDLKQSKGGMGGGGGRFAPKPQAQQRHGGGGEREARRPSPARQTRDRQSPAQTHSRPMDRSRDNGSQRDNRDNRNRVQRPRSQEHRRSTSRDRQRSRSRERRQRSRSRDHRAHRSRSLERPRQRAAVVDKPTAKPPARRSRSLERRRTRSPPRRVRSPSPDRATDRRRSRSRSARRTAAAKKRSQSSSSGTADSESDSDDSSPDRRKSTKKSKSKKTKKSKKDAKPSKKSKRRAGNSSSDEDSEHSSRKKTKKTSKKHRK